MARRPKEIKDTTAEQAEVALAARRLLRQAGKAYVAASQATRPQKTPEQLTALIERLDEERAQARTDLDYALSWSAADLDAMEAAAWDRLQTAIEIAREHSVIE